MVGAGVRQMDRRICVIHLKLSAGIRATATSEAHYLVRNEGEKLKKKNKNKNKKDKLQAHLLLV